MPIQIVRDDITNIKVDAIVNPTDSKFSGKGGVDKQIQDLAGTQLSVDCRNLKTPLKLGKAIVTGSYKLKNAKYIIHTIGPIYKDGESNEDKYLISCYESVLNAAKENNINSIAIPLISTGSFGYPKDEAFEIALHSINKFLLKNTMDVYLVVYDKESWSLANRIYDDVEDRLKEDEEYGYRNLKEALNENRNRRYGDIDDYEYDPRELYIEPFADCLIRTMDRKHFTDPQVYKAAKINKTTFNKIINNQSTPKKENVLAIAIAMKLNIRETQELVEKAGYSFGRTKQDDAIMHFMAHEDYSLITLESLDNWLKKHHLPTIHNDN